MKSYRPNWKLGEKKKKDHKFEKLVALKVYGNLKRNFNTPKFYKTLFFSGLSLNIPYGGHNSNVEMMNVRTR